MPNKFPPALRENAGFKKMKLRMSSIKISHDGTATKKGGNCKKRGTIQRMHEVMVLNGLAAPIAQMGETTSEWLAHQMIAAMGYTVEISQQDYTLVNSQIDFEPLKNFPEQIPQNFLNNHAIEMIKSFPNPCDPIYTPDEGMPTQLVGDVSYLSREEAENLDLVNVATIFSALGMAKTPKNQTSRYCRNSSVNSALKITKR